jgi:hypothetical protein
MTGAGGDPEANQGGGARDMDKYRGVDIGNVIDCEGGSVIVPSYTSARAVDKNGTLIKEWKGTDRHMENFIDVVRSRKSSDLYGPVDEGHISSALCHLGNISHRIGRASTDGETRERIKGSSALSEAYGRMAEHLRANNVDVSSTPLTLGMPLLVDAKGERFTGPDAAAANAHLTRQYRAPFTIPTVTAST